MTDDVFEDEDDELELCDYCGLRVIDPCDEPPPDYCEKAINIVHGQWLND